MNSRERFLEVMRFTPGVRTLKWEFGFWGENIKRWYREGLPRKHGTIIPTNLTTINASVYTTAWTHTWRQQRTYLEKFYGEREREIELPDGIAIWGGALYWPSQGFPLALDVMDYFGFDRSTAMVPVEQLFHPHFEPAILEEDAHFLIYRDIDGVKRQYQKREGVVPSALEWPIKDWASWRQLKEERLRLGDIRQRFPGNWDWWIREYRQRDYPLAVGGYPCGFFGSLVHLIGYENVFLLYYDQPDLLHDILGHLTSLWIAIWEEILADVSIDCAHIWEDMSSTMGTMISPQHFNEFMAPCYRRITGFLRSKGVDIVLVDTDGNIEKLIPQFLDVGVTGMYPMETSAGMDVVKLRQQYPRFQMMGGVPKYDMALGPARIEEFLAPVNALLKHGGYVPTGDHCISPGVSWEQFKYYRLRLNEIIDANGSR
jgi:uroporphyrinogen decarboxylase